MLDPGVSPASLPALLTYFRQGKLDKFFLSGTGGQSSLELDFMAAAGILKPADPAEPCRPIPREFYGLLDANKAAFVVATIGDAELAEAHRGNPNDAYILKRLKDRAVRRCAQFTDDDEVFVANVIRLLTDGALPKTTAKKIAEAMKTEIQPLKILAILRRHIKEEYLQPNPAVHLGQTFAPRQVILSSYLVEPS